MSKKFSAKTIKDIQQYLELKTERKLDDKQIATEMKVSLRQVQRWSSKLQDAIFTDEYKLKMTLKFFNIWLRRLTDAEVDYNNNIKKFDKDGNETIDTQARAQFSKVYNDTIKEAERYLSKIGLLDSETQIIEHKGNVLNELNIINKYLVGDLKEKDKE